VKAEIISIGTELLLGEIVDTNTPFLANQLSLLGIDLYFTSAVGDNRERLLGALRQAWERSDVVLTTGGLGPTQDDITRETIAALLGQELEVDEGLKQNVIDFFAQRGLEMPANNIRQATLIPSATAIPNPYGTAPGWWVEKDGRVIVAMPGPPSEMQFMWQNRVLPRLQKKTGAIILCRMLKTFGLSEAKVDELVAPLMASPNPTLGVYAKLDGIYLRIAAKAARREEAQEMIAGREAEIRAILGDAISPENQSCFKGGLIATTDEVKVALGIDAKLVTGEPSAELATAMAVLARQKLEASIGIGIEGYNEPIGNVVSGTVFIAIDSEQIDQHKVQSYSGRLYQMKRRAAYYALFDLMKILRSA